MKKNSPLIALLLLKNRWSLFKLNKVVYCTSQQLIFLRGVRYKTLNEHEHVQRSFIVYNIFVKKAADLNSTITKQKMNGSGLDVCIFVQALKIVVC